MDSLSECQVLLVYPVRTFNKKYSQGGLTLYNENIDKGQTSVIRINLTLQVQHQYRIIKYALQFLQDPPL